MYQFKGSLTVRKILGRNGEFSVGSVTTPIGIFKVKQSELDQYEQGTYYGQFEIDEIKLVSGYFGSTASMITDCVATLTNINIDIVDEHPVEQTIETDHQSNKVCDAKDKQDNENLKDHSLFNEQQLSCINHNMDVTLDPAHADFRKQITALKSFAYRWLAKEKVWTKNQN